MSRYLTPPKVTLLVLVRLYCDNSVPNDATIPVLSFIISQIIPPLPSNLKDATSADATSDLVLSIEKFEEATASLDSKLPGRSLWDVLVAELWEIKSLHALHEFFDNLSTMLAGTQPEELEENEDPDRANRTLLSRVSPLGLFVRRAQIEFTRLHFHDSMQLWMAFIKYKEPTISTWRGRDPDPDDISFDENLLELGLLPSERLFQVAYAGFEEQASAADIVSTDDIEKLLDFQVERMQRLGNRVPNELKEKFRTMIAPSATIPSLSHFVKFLDAWRAGDFTTALDNLHRYFDYSMQSSNKFFYQSALLHLAILQADFGCFSEAVAAINETITTARENQDMSCLNFSLSWLNHLTKAYPNQMKGEGYMGMLGSERDGLAFLKEKARETKMYNLLSSTLLSEAKLELSNGESLSRAIEHIYQASHLIVRENIHNNMGAQMLMHSALYGRLGITHLLEVYCELLLHIYNANIPTEEKLRAICRCAYTASQSGHYDEAIRMLEVAIPGSQRTLKFHQYLHSFIGLLKLKRSIRRDDQTASAHFLSQLHALPNPDPEVTHLLSLLSIEALSRRGAFEEAFDAIEELGDKLKNDAADIYHRIHALTLKATLFAKCGKPEKGFSIALRAASTAHRARLMPALWEAVGALANCLVIVGEFEAGRRILAAVIPQAIEGEDASIQAQLYSVQADAYMGLAGLETGDGKFEQRMERVKKADMLIDRAKKCYEAIEDLQGACDMIAKKAIIARLRGEEKLADEWAEKYMTTLSNARERNEEGI